MNPPAAGAVALVLVGDELLLGDVLDTNGSWLGQRLHAVGLHVTTSTHVGDGPDAIVTAVRRAAAEAGSVVVTGGLGPTSDDRTREALARLVDRPLWSDPSMAADVRAHARRRDRAPSPFEAAMALAPEGSARIPNPAGSAPGIRLVLDGGAVVHALPGVPSEVRAMVEASVLQDLLAAAGVLPATRRRSLRVVGLGETQAAARLTGVEADLDRDADAALAYLPQLGELEVRLTVRRTSADAADRALAEYVNTAVDALGPECYGTDGDTLAGVVLGALARRGETCATAESLTGGGLGAALTEIPGASSAYRGGVVAYATELKTVLLGVEAEHLRTHGAVDATTALRMAAGVRDRLGATYGLATTGVAGPDSQEGKAVGTVHVAVVGPEVQQVRSLALWGDRVAVRTQAVAHALDLARRTVQARPAGPES